VLNHAGYIPQKFLFLILAQESFFGESFIWNVSEDLHSLM
jgi:hypothetical protein